MLNFNGAGCGQNDDRCFQTHAQLISLRQCVGALDSYAVQICLWLSAEVLHVVGNLPRSREVTGHPILPFCFEAGESLHTKILTALICPSVLVIIVLSFVSGVRVPDGRSVPEGVRDRGCGPSLRPDQCCDVAVSWASPCTLLLVTNGADEVKVGTFLFSGITCAFSGAMALSLIFALFHSTTLSVLWCQHKVGSGAF